MHLVDIREVRTRAEVLSCPPDASAVASLRALTRLCSLLRHITQLGLRRHLGDNLVLRSHWQTEYVRARRLDEIQIHVASVLLGSGTRLFDDNSTQHIELNCLRVVEGKGVAHLKYRIVK